MCEKRGPGSFTSSPSSLPWRFSVGKPRCQVPLLCCRTWGIHHFGSTSLNVTLIPLRSCYLIWVLPHRVWASVVIFQHCSWREISLLYGYAEKLSTLSLWWIEDVSIEGKVHGLPAFGDFVKILEAKITKEWGSSLEWGTLVYRLSTIKLAYYKMCFSQNCS